MHSFALVPLIAVALGACNSSSPQKLVVGRWAFDDQCSSARSIELDIKKTGAGAYTIIATAITPGVRQDTLQGLFRTLAGDPVLEVTGRNRSPDVIEILPEARKLKFEGCIYFKT